MEREAAVSMDKQSTTAELPCRTLPTGELGFWQTNLLARHVRSCAHYVHVTDVHTLVWGDEEGCLHCVAAGLV